MSLTPNDIRSIEFHNQMRGYDKDEVDNFLEKLAQEFELAKLDNAKIRLELDTMRVQMTGLKENEDIIKGAAIDARRNADLTINNAKKEAQLLLDKAKEEIEKFAELKKKKIQEIEQHINKIEQNRKNYLTKLRGLVASHLELFEKESVTEVREVMSQPVEKPVEKRVERPGDIKVTESKDITTDKMETIAGPLVDKAEKTSMSMEMRTTVHGESTVETDHVEEVDEGLSEVLRRNQQIHDAIPPFMKGKDEDSPEPIPSLASPKKKWAETTARAEEVPSGFVARNQEASVENRPLSPNSQSLEHNPVLMEEIEAKQTVSTPKTSRTGKIDVAKEFDEIAAKFNEEMDKADKKR